MFNPDSDFTHPMLPKRTPLIPEALLSLAAKLPTGESGGTLETLLFLRSECILRQGQAFFPVLVCSIQPRSLRTHARTHAHLRARHCPRSGATVRNFSPGTKPVPSVQTGFTCVHSKRRSEPGRAATYTEDKRIIWGSTKSVPWLGLLGAFSAAG